MRDNRKPPDGVIDMREDLRIRTLASTAIHRLALQRSAEPAGNLGATVGDFCDALIAPREEAHQNVISVLVARGVPSEQIYSKYVPAAARMLGERWVRDEIGFMDVTTGAARLQNLVRAYSSSQAASGVALPLGQSVLMVVPTFEQHTLGAFMAADAFRRLGLWVHLAIWQEPEEIAAATQTGRFGLLGISANCETHLEHLCDLIERVRRHPGGTPPIVIGGALVSSTEDLEKRTGADYATNDPRLAVKRFDLAGMTDAIPARQVN